MQSSCSILFLLLLLACTSFLRPAEAVRSSGLRASTEQLILEDVSILDRELKKGKGKDGDDDDEDKKGKGKGKGKKDDDEDEESSVSSSKSPSSGKSKCKSKTKSPSKISSSSIEEEEDDLCSDVEVTVTCDAEGNGTVFFNILVTFEVELNSTAVPNCSALDEDLAEDIGEAAAEAYNEVTNCTAANVEIIGFSFVNCSETDPTVFDSARLLEEYQQHRDLQFGGGTYFLTFEYNAECTNCGSDLRLYDDTFGRRRKLEDVDEGLDPESCECRDGFIFDFEWIIEIEEATVGVIPEVLSVPEIQEQEEVPAEEATPCCQVVETCKAEETTPLMRRELVMPIPSGAIDCADCSLTCCEPLLEKVGCTDCCTGAYPVPIPCCDACPDTSTGPECSSEYSYSIYSPYEISGYSGEIPRRDRLTKIGECNPNCNFSREASPKCCLDPFWNEVDPCYTNCCSAEDIPEIDLDSLACEPL